MKVLDLFAGIGGFSLAAHWMGWETVAFVEREPFCQKVLRKNFGDGIEIHNDIFEFDGRPFRGAVDIITGGFPCQPFSAAGKRKGTADDRHLWPEMFRTIVDVQPRYIVAENVFGFINWSGGLVFEQVQADLESAGYEVWAGVVPAASVGAPHRRNRVWIVAKSRGIRCDNGGDYRQGRYVSPDVGISAKSQPKRGRWINGVGPSCATIVDTESTRLSRRIREKRSGRNEPHRSHPPRWENFPTQSSVCGRDDGIPNRVDRIKALGNSIVPQIALEIFRAIEAAEKKNGNL
jgi:DNA (cytosine-5)-methyltransferase 1